MECTTIWLSPDWKATYFPDGWRADRTIEYMYGSAMRVIGTGMPYSQARRDLSSEVEMKRRFSSTKVIVLTGPRW